jgi:hypothetical protein
MRFTIASRCVFHSASHSAIDAGAFAGLAAADVVAAWAVVVPPTAVLGRIVVVLPAPVELLLLPQAAMVTASPATNAPMRRCREPLTGLPLHVRTNIELPAQRSCAGVDITFTRIAFEWSTYHEIPSTAPIPHCRPRINVRLPASVNYRTVRPDAFRVKDCAHRAGAIMGIVGEQLLPHRSTMAVMAHDEVLADRIRDLLVGEPNLTEKRMFGGLAFLVGGNMAVSASGQGGVLVRVDPARSDTLVAKTNARMAVMRGREMQGWLRVDPDDLRTRRQLARWVELGTTYARTLPPKPD